jgi:ribonuclease P protein component
VKRRFRLRRKADFAAVLKGRRVYSGRGLVVIAMPTRHDEGRIGVTSSRQLKTAVERNRARRRVRELARLSLLEADSGSGRGGIRYDVVLIARPAALTLRFADLKEETEQAALRLSNIPSES